MLRTFTAIVTGLLVVGAARASPYWIDYEGASGQFPEEQGWQRITNGGGANRWFDDGWLVIDGTASTNITDYYAWHLDGHLDPGPGEEFVAIWRIRVDDLNGRHDPGLSIRSDAGWRVGFVMSLDTIESIYEDGISAPFEPGVDHIFALRSDDMRAYTLSIDGVPEIEGNFWFSLSGASQVQWGDMVNGASSLARWNYYQFGVVPESSTVVLGSTAAVVLVLVQRGR